MLNGETKRKIQSLRDTLVGKLPAPTDQVKQITLGLIYKFMSDIDKENVDLLGGKSFFAGELEKYSWDNILDPSISSYERVMLYSEGLDKMNLNPNIPELFRNIFKGSYLPYKDPAILTQFLKEIDMGFKYEHSEDLGDAFEFLLSIMSMQGAAGQFRTPRHIIDFIVKVVEPSKNDKVLDPACGTAGFLISAYKYILENNKANDSDKPGSGLSLTEKNKLTENFTGYDISPDMVSLSLVNMYLHNFPNPNIKEYDTLTNEDLWDEDFDTIMANPPFMTPKGGIRPHKRFAIKCSRAEVLFVDYIVEHLTPVGKGAVIVPEGIIENFGSAFRNLRKTIIDDNYLYAVVSLPIGTFQPYSSNIKTSILFFDRNIAENTEFILFVKIENDGFELGKQRKLIKENDLPLALEVIKSFKQNIITNNLLKLSVDSKIKIVKKNTIRQTDDYSLIVEKYQDTQKKSNENYQLFEIQELFNIEKGKLQSSKNIDGKYCFITASQDWKTHNTYTHDCESIIFAMGASGSLGRTHYFEGKFIASDLCFILTQKNNSKPVNLKFYYEYFKTIREQIVNDIAKGAAKKAINATRFKKYKIPYIKLEKQIKIMSIIENFKKQIDLENKKINEILDNIKTLDSNIKKVIINMNLDTN